MVFISEKWRFKRRYALTVMRLCDVLISSFMFNQFMPLWSLFSSGGRRSGTCFTSSECASRGGSPRGGCAAGWDREEISISFERNPFVWLSIGIDWTPGEKKSAVAWRIYFSLLLCCTTVRLALIGFVSSQRQPPDFPCVINLQVYESL